MSLTNTLTPSTIRSDSWIQNPKHGLVVALKLNQTKEYFSGWTQYDFPLHSTMPCRLFQKKKSSVSLWFRTPTFLHLMDSPSLKHWSRAMPLIHKTSEERACINNVNAFSYKTKTDSNRLPFCQHPTEQTQLCCAHLTSSKARQVI